MKKADISSSAGTKVESSTNADILQASQPIAKPDVMRRFVISKELFVETIEKIKQQYNHDLQCAEKLKDVFPNAFIANLMYENHYIMNQLVKLLQVAFNDETEYSMIEYFLWELDFGKKNNELSAYRADKSKIDLSNAGKLYDYLTENITTNG